MQKAVLEIPSDGSPISLPPGKYEAGQNLWVVDENAGFEAEAKVNENGTASLTARKHRMKLPGTPQGQKMTAILVLAAGYLALIGAVIVSGGDFSSVDTGNLW